ncbi:hypothetical protein, partial [Collinsella aerofaciens]
IIAVYGVNDMAPWGHMYVNPGLTEPLKIIRYAMIFKSPSQNNHPSALLGAAKKAPSQIN